MAEEKEKLPTIYIRNFPEGLYIRVKVHVIRERTTLRELTIKALEEYLDRHEKGVK